MKGRLKARLKAVLDGSAEGRALRLALPVLRARRRGLALLSLTGLLATFAETAALALTIPLLDGELELGGIGRHLAALDDVTRVVVVGGAMVGLLCVRSALTWANARLGVALHTDIAKVATLSAMRTIGRMPLDFVHATGQARLLDAAEGAPDALAELVMEVVEMITAAASLVVIVVAMAVLSGPMVLLVVGVGCVTTLVVRGVTRRVEPLAAEVVEREELQGEHALSFVESQRLLRASAAGDEGIAEFERGADELASVYVRYEGINALIDPINTLAGAALVIAGLAYAALNPAELPLVLFFVAMAFRLQPRFSDLDASRHALVTLAPDVRRLDWLASHAREPADAPACEPGREPSAEPTVGTWSDDLARPARLDIAGLRFGHDAREPLYDGASLAVRPGELVAIVGDSGVGKSTLLDLILQLRPSDAGTVRLDGRDARDVSRRAWLARIGWVPQRVELLPMSLRRNLCLGIDAPDDARILDALDVAGAAGFVAALPDGLDTLVGRRGRAFSEGQLQRLGFARALLRRPGLLLLDEPTSALDPESVRGIRAALENVRGRVTVVLVAHADDVVGMADRVVRLRGGRLTESSSAGAVGDRTAAERFVG